MGLDVLSLYIKNSFMSSVLAYLSEQHIWGEQGKNKLQYSLKKKWSEMWRVRNMVDSDRGCRKVKKNKE